MEQILAARFPKPDVRESIRKLPVRLAADAATAEVVLPTEVGPRPLTASALELDPVLSAVPAIAQPTMLATSSPPSKATARVEPLSVDRYGVHFTADGEFRDLLEAARALASHRLPAGNIAELIKLALKASSKMRRSDALRLDGNRVAVE